MITIIIATTTLIFIVLFIKTNIKFSAFKKKYKDITDIEKELLKNQNELTIVQKKVQLLNDEYENRKIKISADYDDKQKILNDLLSEISIAFGTVSIIAILMVIFSSIAILQMEDAPNSNIKTAEDAIWWAYVTVTTVGYGDKFPVTTEGRIIAAALMYSKGKTGDDYLFPKTINGNFYPNQKFNQHIKEVGKLCRLLRPVSRPLHSGKKIVEGTEDKKQLFEVLSSHTGRRTFIKEGIINKIEPYVIMSMVGHKSLRVFERYFSMNDEDRKVSNQLFSFVSDNPKVQLKSKGSIKERLKELKELLKEQLIDNQVYKEKENEILKEYLT